MDRCQHDPLSCVSGGSLAYAEEKEREVDKVCRVLRKCHLQRGFVTDAQCDAQYIARNTGRAVPGLPEILSNAHVLIRIFSFITPPQLFSSVFPACRSFHALQFSSVLWRVVYLSTGPLKYCSKLQEVASLLFAPLEGSGFMIPELEERERYLDLVVVLIVCGYYRCIQACEGPHATVAAGLLQGKKRRRQHFGKGGADPLELFSFSVGYEVARQFSGQVYGSFHGAAAPVWHVLFEVLEPPKTQLRGRHHCIVGKTRCGCPPGVACAGCSGPALPPKVIRAILLGVSQRLFSSDVTASAYDFTIHSRGGCEVEVDLERMDSAPPSVSPACFLLSLPGHQSCLSSPSTPGSIPLASPPSSHSSRSNSTESIKFPHAPPPPPPTGVLQPNFMYYTRCIKLLDLLISEGAAGHSNAAKFVEAEILDGRETGLRRTPAERREVQCKHCGIRVTCLEYAKNHARGRCAHSGKSAVSTPATPPLLDDAGSSSSGGTSSTRRDLMLQLRLRREKFFSDAMHDEHHSGGGERLKHELEQQLRDRREQFFASLTTEEEEFEREDDDDEDQDAVIAIHRCSTSLPGFA